MTTDSRLPRYPGHLARSAISDANCEHGGGVAVPTSDEVFGTNFGRWSKVVAGCRNDLAHRKSGTITPETSGLYAAVVYSLRWFLIAVLLLETGISQNDLRKRILEKQAYRPFVQRAPDMLPEVYGPDGDASEEESSK